MSKVTTFRVTQTYDVPSADCHSLETYAMSHFGTTELPAHIKVEIVNVDQGDDAATVGMNEAPKGEDEQPATDSPA